MGNPNPKHKFQKGVVTNPNGRPKREWTVKGLIEDALEEQSETGVPYKLLVTQKLRKLALNGDVTAIKEVFNRLDGMPTQPIEQSGTVTYAPENVEEAVKNWIRMHPDKHDIIRELIE